MRQPVDRPQQIVENRALLPNEKYLVPQANHSRAQFVRTGEVVGQAVGSLGLFECQKGSVGLNLLTFSKEDAFDVTSFKIG